MIARAKAYVLSGASVAVLCTVCAGCTSFEIATRPPVAEAGDDQDLSGESVSVTLDGSASFDPDGSIIAYEWRYTGPPDGYPAGDGGVVDPLQPLLDPLPEFCAEPDPSRHADIPARYCLLAADSGGDERVELTLGPGAYRFTLWVTDDDGKVSADSVVVRIAAP